MLPYVQNFMKLIDISVEILKKPKSNGALKI